VRSLRKKTYPPLLETVAKLFTPGVLTIMIETVTMYKCLETGKLFKTSRGAENSSERARKKKLADSIDRKLLAEQQDYVRLNATSPREIIELVKSKAEEFWGLKITRFDHLIPKIIYHYGHETISFGGCVIEVDASESSRFEYLRETNPSIAELLFGGHWGRGFKGLETGNGCSGRCNEYKFDMDLRARLDQFPIIQAHYRDWVKHKEEYDSYQDSKTQAKVFGQILAASTPESKSLKDLRKYYLDCAYDIKQSMDEVEEHHTEGFLEKWATVNPEPEKNKDLWDKFG
jgi:hypothetical protein